MESSIKLTKPRDIRMFTDFLAAKVIKWLADSGATMERCAGFIWCDCDIYWFVIQIKSDTMSTDSLDIKEFYPSAWHLYFHPGRLPLLAFNLYFTESPNNYVQFSAQDADARRVQVSVICFLLMIAVRGFGIKLRFIVGQPLFIHFYVIQGHSLIKGLGEMDRNWKDQSFKHLGGRWKIIL